MLPLFCLQNTKWRPFQRWAKRFRLYSSSTDFSRDRKCWLKYIKSFISLKSFFLPFSREVRTFLAEQLQPLSNEEQKEWLSNITSHIQSQGLSTPNVEIAHIELAIKVSPSKMTFWTQMKNVPYREEFELFKPTTLSVQSLPNISFTLNSICRTGKL